MCAFVSNKSFCQLLNTSAENFIFLKTFDSKFSYIEGWFTDQNSNPLEIEGKIDTALVINQSITFKDDTPFSSTKRSKFSFAKNKDRNIGKNVTKNLSNNYSQKLPDHAKKIC